MFLVFKFKLFCDHPSKIKKYWKQFGQTQNYYEIPCRKDFGLNVYGSMFIVGSSAMKSFSLETSESMTGF